MRQRLRPAYTPEELADLYRTPHRHFGKADHRLRIAVTIQVARAFGPVESAADLACGDGAVLAALEAKQRYWGDFAPGWPITGPIEETLNQIPDVDLFVCTETLEHLDDPDTVLKGIRAKTRHLVMSTPVDAWSDAEKNREHYWAWSRAGLEEMLAAAEFQPTVYTELDLTYQGGDHYRFGIFACQ